MEEAILKVNATLMNVTSLKDDITNELKLKLRNLTHQAVNRLQIKYLKSRLEKKNQHIDELFKKIQNLMQHHEAEIRKIKSESMKNETELQKQISGMDMLKKHHHQYFLRLQVKNRVTCRFSIIFLSICIKTNTICDKKNSMVGCKQVH